LGCLTLFVESDCAGAAFDTLPATWRERLASDWVGGVRISLADVNKAGGQHVEQETVNELMNSTASRVIVMVWLPSA